MIVVNVTRLRMVDAIELIRSLNCEVMGETASEGSRVGEDDF